MWSLFTILLAICNVNSQSDSTTPQSPCPNVFMYEPQGSEPGRWYGVITLSTDITLHGLWLNVVLDNKADIVGNWVGDVTTTDNMDFKVENTKMKIQPGPAQAVRFFVQYNQLNKVPRLQAIRLNGREICNANNPLPAVDRPLDPRPEEFTPRPLEDNRPSRPVSTRKPSRPNTATQRPEAVSIVVPQTDLRNDDRSVTRPAQNQNRPSGDGPVYVPTQNPPYEGSNANPYSIVSNGKLPSQAVTDRATSRPKPHYEEPDFSDYNSHAHNDDDYFNGGLPTIINVTGGQQSNQANNRNNAQCGRVLRNGSPNPLVVNGKPTLEGQWPWQIALYQTQTVDSKYICGGTLVSKRHVITAAHCVTRKGSSRVVNKNTLTVYLGKHNLRTSVEGVQIRLVGEIIVHYQYNASSFSKDAGILELREQVRYTEWVQPACLWPESQLELSYVIGKRGSVVGWGFDDKGVATEELTLVEMPIVDQETCIRSYSEFFTRFTSEYTFCAGYRDGVYDSRTGTLIRTSVCNGDSGGGMVFEMQNSWYLRGLVSLSVARQNEYRCDPSHYVIFTDLAKFLPWIKQIVGKDL